jgi:copper resistance protein B
VKRLALMALLPLAIATPAAAQGMADMPGMATPAPAASSDADDPDIPDTPAPPAPTDHLADRVYDPAAMAEARATLQAEHGGATVSTVMINLAEYQTGPAGGGYRWDGQAFIGGDLNRLVIKSEGEGSGRDGLGDAEVQGLYSHAIGPYFDLQAGVRQDFGRASQTYATAGVEGVLPYWFDVEAAVFLSTEGEVLGRIEGTYDLRLTQKLILQPRVELDLAAQDDPRIQTGSGLSNAELGLRLRYEIRRQFAPYIGVSYDRDLGRTAEFDRLRGDYPGGASFVAGVRSWF